MIDVAPQRIDGPVRTPLRSRAPTACMPTRGWAASGGDARSPTVPRLAAAIAGLAPWSMTTARSGCRSSMRSSAGNCAGLTSASKRRPSRGSAARARSTSLAQDPVGVREVLQHRPDRLQQRVAREALKRRRSRPRAARSTQPTTPRTSPPLACATPSRNSVSATVGAACTSTVAPMPAAAISGRRSASEKSR